MSRDLTVTMSYPAPVDRVLAMLTDPDYVHRKASALQGSEIVTEVTTDADGNTKVVCGRSIPADVPAAAKPFVGDHINVTETHVWAPAAGAAGRDGKVDVAFAGAPVSVKGTIKAAGTGDGTTVTYAVTVSAGVPFIGAKLEELVADQLEDAISYEESLGRDWLANA